MKVKFFDTLSEFFRVLIGKNKPKLKNECVGPSSGFRLERAEIEESTMNNLKNDVGFGWFDESKKHVFRNFFVIQFINDDIESACPGSPHLSFQYFQNFYFANIFYFLFKMMKLVDGLTLNYNHNGKVEERLSA